MAKSSASTQVFKRLPNEDAGDDDAQPTPKELALTRMSSIQSKLVVVATDQNTYKFLLVSGCGAVVVGSAGAACGLAAGTTAGALVGTVPALLTFGLSIPAGGAIGGALGALVGGGSAFVGGGISGGVGYVYRVEVQNGVVKVKTKVASGVASGVTFGKHKTVDVMEWARANSLTFRKQAARAIGRTEMKAIELYTASKTKAVELSTMSCECGAIVRGTVSNRKTQVVAASATGGAVALGVSGGAVGLTAGGAIGAACGFVPALFTFGLSIPIGAVIGSGAGLCAGTAIGGTTGFVGGGAVGYGSYTKREAIGSGANEAWMKAGDCAGYVKDKVGASTNYVKSKLVGGTGGTD